MKTGVKAKSMRCRFFFSCLLLLVGSFWLAPPAMAQDDTLRPAAVVNDEVISLLDLAMRTRLAILASGAQDTPQVRERLVPQVLRNLIVESPMNTRNLSGTIQGFEWPLCLLWR